MLLLLQTPAVSLREVLAARRALLERVCKVYETSGSRDAEVVSYPIDPSRFFYMQEPNFLFCMIPKVASTSFSGFLINAHQKFSNGKQSSRK
jgi:hypothetical protein